MHHEIPHLPLLEGLSKPPSETHVVVAMSGGVDSSTVAVLLHQAGYQVTGVTLQLYDAAVSLQRKGACCAGQDIYDAKEVAERFGFPHYVLNYEDRFRQAVIDDFVEDYMQGTTPVPCIRCNQTVKFHDLLGLAKELKAEALVTGHYVQRRRAASGEWALCKAMDPRKDQSYFLFATTKEQLAFSHFPLGGWSKEQTRAVALSLGIPVANKPDSQDICFVPNGDYASVIAKLRPGALDPGEIVHADGRVLGHHAGIIHYTIGQRRGLGISSPEPLYVIRLEAEARRVIVGPESLLAQRHFTMHTPHWLGDGDFPEGPFEVTVRLRSAHRGALATVQRQGPNEARVTMHADEKAITPGQAAVFYDGDRVLGGGWIRRVLPAESVMEPVPSDTKCQI